MRRIEAIRDKADKDQDAVIADVRRDLLIPYCNRTKLRFTAGMGSWSLDKPGPYGNDQTYLHYGGEFPGRMPKALNAFLHERSTFSNNDLGSLMLDYTPPGWRHFTDGK